ncbi:MAG TPA: hypothetical protein GXX17_01880 [Clostridiales bacterium]|nr:hypothetical protein [Clostridiales bacterium]
MLTLKIVSRETIDILILNVSRETFYSHPEVFHVKQSASPSRMFHVKHSEPKRQKSGFSNLAASGARLKRSKYLPRIGDEKQPFKRQKGTGPFPTGAEDTIGRGCSAARAAGQDRRVCDQGKNRGGKTKCFSAKAGTVGQQVGNKKMNAMLVFAGCKVLKGKKLHLTRSG